MNHNKINAGYEIRREVLGNKNVEKFINNTTDFNKSFRELAMEYCWGGVWNSPGLSKKTRSMLNIAIMTALNYQDELKVHLNGALRNGCTKKEIEEILLQCAIYCGIPAAGTSFKTATNFFEENE